MNKKRRNLPFVSSYTYFAHGERPVALHDLQKVPSLFLVARDGTAERADEGDASLSKVVHHP